MRLLQTLGHRKVFEHNQGIEQRFTGRTRPALDIKQRCVLMLAHLQVKRLYRAHPVDDTLRRIGRRDQRQGVDEQADLLLDAHRLRRPPRYRHPAGHAGLAGIALQQQ